MIDNNSREQAVIEKLVYKAFEIGKTQSWQDNQELHYEDRRFSKFSQGPPYERMALRDTLEEEQRFFSSIQDYSFSIDGLQVDLFGNTAIATFMVEQAGKIIKQDYAGKENAAVEEKDGNLKIKCRASIVFLNFANAGEPARWQIAHEHFSRVGNESSH